MRNVIGGLCVGFGFCWGVMIAVGLAAVLINATGRLMGSVP